MQFNKVQIAAVDTAQLKVLTDAEIRALLKRTKNGDRAAREELIKGNLRLVLSVVQRFSARSENADDLFQVGCIGLIKAVDNFDIALNVRFSTYAVPMIIGEVRRYLRDNNSLRVSRSMRDLAYHAMNTREALANRLNRDPTPDEIAKEMGVSRRQVIIAMEAVMEPLSLYEPINSENGEALYVVDQLGSCNDEGNWIDEICFREAVGRLPVREKQILRRRFLEGRTQVEVAKEIGISQAQVSRLEKNAIRKIKGE
ncbi:MAG: RNA polymerase sporulation sigma factor SigG [Clostridia bacterium]|nr:RNA polymerase sporulation sigma factor SigG [Clostridia bacterium]MBR0509441.1 RNA polymerase sporulation sigma factor SigG [Clostridia bacterium]